MTQTQRIKKICEAFMIPPPAVLSEPAAVNAAIRTFPGGAQTLGVLSMLSAAKTNAFGNAEGRNMAFELSFQAVNTIYDAMRAAVYETAGIPEATT